MSQNSQFVHLHLHTQYSLLDGLNKIPAVLEQAAALGQPAIAMTDHGNMHGAVEFYTAARAVGIKPIIGCELYVTPGSRLDRQTKARGGAGTYHLTVLAKDQKGYLNLCKLVSLAYKEGFYFKPRVDHELLARYNEGLIVLSGCLTSEFSWYARESDERRCEQLIEFYLQTYGSNFYFEVQPHPIPEQQLLNEACAMYAKKRGVPLVATTDCHYGSKDDHYAQEVLMCVSTGKQITDPDRIRHEGLTLHLKNADEMREELALFSGGDEAVRNTLEIAEQCNVEFDFSTHYMPQFASEDPRPLIEIMSEMARSGLTRRLEVIAEKDPNWTEERRKLYEERLEEEIALIDSMGFAGYFLVVSDFIVWAKEHDVPVGPGRGSVAGSLVAYAMRITDVEPISNKLIFERFLNPERVSLPDIDVDFCVEGRDRVIAYVVEKYGKERVAQIATFGTLKAKAAIKDVGRALGIGYAETDRVAQLVPAPRQGFDYSLAEALKMEPRLKEYAEGDGKDLIHLARKIEGLNRHSSTHAAGVVIGDRPLDEFLPMMVDKDGNDVTQFSMNYVEKIGLVKFDFLGLKTLTVIHTALRLIKESSAIDIELERLDLDDSEAYKLLCAGDTTGVFQLESSGITEMTMRLKPNCFDDLVAILALYRPGPLDAGMVDVYINRKHGREPVTYLVPEMEGILADTYGILLYQEQIMQLARVLAGYSLGEADILRKAMGKKNPEEMAKQRERFLSGAVERGLSSKLANEVFDQMETFARYGFNRSHSTAYAMVSFQTAYLKAHHPVEFMAALMSHEMDDSDKVLKNLNECRKQQIEVLPPDVNVSGSRFSVQEGKIRYGLSAVKAVGERAVEVVQEERSENGPFADLEDFIERVDLRALNKRVVENLIKCGAFDFSKVSRREMFERLDDVIRAGQALQRDRDENQVSLFSDGVIETGIPRRQTNVVEWPINRKLAFEREALGFYISGHPLTKYQNVVKQFGAITTEDLKSAQKSQQAKAEVCTAGIVTALKLKNTKRGDRYATCAIEDWLGTIETLIWPDVYREVASYLGSDDPIIVRGRLDVTDERCVLVVSAMESLIELRDRRATQGILRVKAEDDLESSLQKLKAVFKRHEGVCPVRMLIEVNGAEVAVALRDDQKRPLKVKPSETLCDEVEQLYGRPVLFFAGGR